VGLDVKEIFLMGGISIWQLLIVLVIVVLLFGTKRLKSIGSDLGGAVKGFKKAVTDEESDADFSQEKRVENKNEAQSVEAESKADVKEKS
tara:strand:- start:88 stop:357 length:270 start_codon:yes stop_codon:yes gene_type:complete